MLEELEASGVNVDLLQKYTELYRKHIKVLLQENIEKQSKIVEVSILYHLRSIGRKSFTSVTETSTTKKFSMKMMPFRLFCENNFTRTQGSFLLKT